jgi:hypothetical protein
MTLNWGSCIVLFGCLALLGCRTTPPNLKPPKAPEVLTPPASEARYDSPDYPKQAFSQPDDPGKRMIMDGKNQPGGGGMGGMGGMGRPGG